MLSALGVSTKDHVTIHEVVRAGTTMLMSRNRTPADGCWLFCEVRSSRLRPMFRAGSNPTGTVVGRSWHGTYAVDGGVINLPSSLESQN